MKTIRFLWPLLAIFALTLWVGACSDDDPADPVAAIRLTPRHRKSLAATPRTVRPVSTSARS